MEECEIKKYWRCHNHRVRGLPLKPFGWNGKCSPLLVPKFQATARLVKELLCLDGNCSSNFLLRCCNSCTYFWTGCSSLARNSLLRIWKYASGQMSPARRLQPTMFLGIFRCTTRNASISCCVKGDKANPYRTARIAVTLTLCACVCLSSDHSKDEV